MRDRVNKVGQTHGTIISLPYMVVAEVFIELRSPFRTKVSVTLRCVKFLILTTGKDAPAVHDRTEQST